ncbi:MAG: sulfatase-like hydrolase/transferase, partial [Planctomycetota bacterium]
MRPFHLHRPSDSLFLAAFAFSCCFQGADASAAERREAEQETDKTSAERPPNIVFFFADDQTTSTLGCYGNEIVRTPNIDALAARGVRFDNAFVSQAICWVSRTSILSGLTGRSYGTASAPELARADAVETLYSDILRQHGYRTGYFGKWHA